MCLTGGTPYPLAMAMHPSEMKAFFKSKALKLHHDMRAARWKFDGAILSSIHGVTRTIGTVLSRSR